MSTTPDAYSYPPGMVPPAEDNGAPPLHDVSDGGRVAIFDPDRCDSEACWIQIDERHAIDLRRCR